MTLPARFDEKNFHRLCHHLYKKDKDLANIQRKYGNPPMWIRPATFQTLILTILEQQISLASAYAAFKKLKQKLGRITPDKILSLTDEELRACYFSRQKIIYVRELANAILSKQLSLRKLSLSDDDSIRLSLKTIKGIGDWTVDIYLIHALRRVDVFPIGDLALVKSLKEIKGLPAPTTREELLSISKQWQPYRTIATMILWHSYIQKRGIKLQH